MKIIPAVELAALGYSGDPAGEPLIRSLLARHSDRLVATLADLVDGAPQLDEARRRTFLELRPSGSGAAATGLRRAGMVINNWLDERADQEGAASPANLYSPAPIVVHITGSLPSDDADPDGSFDDWAARLASLATADGSPLLVNVVYPAHDSSGTFLSSEQLNQMRLIARYWHSSTEISKALRPLFFHFSSLPWDDELERRLLIHGSVDPDLIVRSLMPTGS